MSLVLSVFIAAFFCMATGIPLEYRFIAFAIIVAGGLAGIGRD